MDATHGLCYGRGSPLDLIQRRLLRAGHSVVCFAEELISYYQVNYMSGEEVTCVGRVERSGVKTGQEPQSYKLSPTPRVQKSAASSPSSHCSFIVAFLAFMCRTVSLLCAQVSVLECSNNQVIHQKLSTPIKPA